MLPVLLLGAVAFVLGLLAVGAIPLIVGLIYIYLRFFSPSIPALGPEAFQYRSSNEPTVPYSLPPTTAPAECDLSIIIPAYNEARRLPPMLTEALDHVLGGRFWKTVEFLIIDDGSEDNTADVALSFPVPEEDRTWVRVSIRVVRLPQNGGKGAAVRHGMLHARGERMLMVDADGASRFSDLDRLWTAMDAGADVVCGSRAHPVGTDAVVTRSLIRKALMFGLHTILKFLGVAHTRDTQCGFKLFTRPAAHTLFQNLHIPRWIFDVEILVVALKCGMKIDEVAIGWHEVEGSKIDIIWDSLGMLRDLLVLRANYLLRRWKVTRAEGPDTNANGTVGNRHVTTEPTIAPNGNARRRTGRPA